MKLRAWCSSRERGWASHACWPMNSRAEEWHKQENERKEKGRKKEGHCGGTEEFFWEFWGKEYWWNFSRKLRIEKRRVAGKSPGHGTKKEDFQVWPFFYIYIFHFFSYCPGLIVSDFSFLLVGLFCFGDYWLNIGRVCCVLCLILTSIFHRNSLDVGPMDEMMKGVRYAG